MLWSVQNGRSRSRLIGRWPTRCEHRAYFGLNREPNGGVDGEISSPSKTPTVFEGIDERGTAALTE